MAMEEDLIARLTASAGIAALCGARVAWFGRPRGDGYPCLILSTIDPGREYTHGGADGLDGPRVQFDCYAATDIGAIALKRAVLAEMEASATVGDTVFHNGFLESEATFDEGEQDGGGSLFRVSQDFTFYHEETAP